MDWKEVFGLVLLISFKTDFSLLLPPWKVIIVSTSSFDGVLDAIFVSSGVFGASTLAVLLSIFSEVDLVSALAIKLLSGCLFATVTVAEAVFSVLTS